MENQIVKSASGSNLVQPFERAARYAAGMLQLAAEHGGRDSFKIVSVRKSDDGRKVLAVLPTVAGSFIGRKTGLDLTPQTLAGIVLASRGFLCLTPDGLGLTTVAAREARRAESKIGARMAQAFGREAKSLVSGIDEDAIERATAGITFA